MGDRKYAALWDTNEGASGVIYQDKEDTQWYIYIPVGIESNKAIEIADSMNKQD